MTVTPNRIRWNDLWEELRHHLPFSAFSVAVAITVLGLISYVSTSMGVLDSSQASYGMFHVFHPLHMLFSAMATTAMFWRHERKFFKTIAIGFIGATGVCGLSDILMPFYSGRLLGVEMHWHICVVEHPEVILPFVAVGGLIGLLVPEVRKSTIFSHSAHVLASSMASIFYLVSFGLTEWIGMIGMVFIYMILAVLIPCCISDIVFPLLLTRKEEGIEEDIHGH